MQGMTYTKRDAQEAMQKLMQGNVVLVGHALQLDPTAVIDTALLCSYKYANSCPDLCSMWHAASCAVLHFLPASHTF